ncbi:MAG: MoxR family ATPase [Defluviitaleaceae bacterium]|nr:MoxR family ATPase [Defluviitaleaceae bacterium]MCL2239163.1 MoxR family ATPase [Defluviitaleaceae bacterium]
MDEHKITNNAQAVRTMQAIISNVEKVIVGKRYAVSLVMATLACRGHVLIEDVPGVGKTSLVAALARSVSGSFKRIQFTPDIMPSDITGYSAFSPKTGEFEYRAGAVMSQFVLADEINRTSPKTQSSLLEVMEENTVTVDGQTYDVPKPFIVLATQNPVEYLGTYALPEAQLDRFFMKITLGYPDDKEESKMLDRFKGRNPLAALQAVAEGEDIIRIQELVEEIHVDESINNFIVNIARYTRAQEDVQLGASPRASLCLYKAAQAWALYNGREYVIPDDVIQMAPHVLEHRILMKQEAAIKKIRVPDIIAGALKEATGAVL